MGLVAFVFPKGGWKPLKALGIDPESEFTLYFATWDDFFAPDTTKAKDIDEILANLTGGDTVVSAAVDTSGQYLKAADVDRLPKSIQYPNDDPRMLFSTFEALDHSRESARPVRILHFGDSQIEGDRMSSLFRARIQERFGGVGPGLVSAKPLTSSMSVTRV
jgi:hypothetical protein